MSEFAILALAVIAALALFAVVSNVADAVENIRIAKHTGLDPRMRTTMSLKGNGEQTSQAVVEAGERLARDAVRPAPGAGQGPAAKVKETGS